MKLIDISDRNVTVELTPEDCQRLAVMCDDFAHGHDRRSLLIAMAGMYATAFEAAARAQAVGLGFHLQRHGGGSTTLVVGPRFVIPLAHSTLRDNG